jgi:hypothetical protein
MGIFSTFFSSQGRKIADGLEIRRLRHRHPFVYRGFITSHHDVRVETDAEYLARLRSVHDERQFAARTGQMNPLSPCYAECPTDQCDQAPELPRENLSAEVNLRPEVIL